MLFCFLNLGLLDNISNISISDIHFNYLSVLFAICSLVALGNSIAGYIDEGYGLICL